MIIKEYTAYNEDEIVSLYTDVGWKAYTDDLVALHSGYENSLLILAAYEGDACYSGHRTSRKELRCI